ncbi:hypothetical protein HYS00_02845 [Candidatus Microgenomates bacterium]|nr:hypothetical protein [Candidatus Microgenomates bacterium]
MRSRGPYIAITVLIAIAVFMGGVRYGQRIEQLNKKITYLISLTPRPPSPSPLPTPLSVTYKTYANKQCPVSFLYPSYLKKTKETSMSAQFDLDDVPQLAFSCELKKPAFTDFTKEVVATEAAKLNVATGRKIYFKLNPDLLPLLESSIEYKTVK